MRRLLVVNFIQAVFGYPKYRLTQMAVLDSLFVLQLSLVGTALQTQLGQDQQIQQNILGKQANQDAQIQSNILGQKNRHLMSFLPNINTDINNKVRA